MNIAQKIIEAHKLKFGSLPPLQQCGVSGSTLLLGDCLEVMKYIPDTSVDMILCDLPYGTTACKWDSIIDLPLLWEQYNRIIKDNGAIVLTASQPFTTKLISSNYEMFKYEWIWVKNTSSNFLQSNYQPIKRHENILVFSKSNASYTKKNTKMKYFPIMNETEKVYSERKNQSIEVGLNSWKNRMSDNYEFKRNKNKGTFPKSVINFAGKISNKNHPTEKPLELMKYLIKTYSLENDLVLDNCMGSGTTCLAAKELNRKFIGIEKEVKYYELAVARVFGQHCHQRFGYMRGWDFGDEIFNRSDKAPILHIPCYSQCFQLIKLTNMKYRIELSEEQMSLIAQCLEDVSRFASGQWEMENTIEAMVKGLPFEEQIKRRDEAEELLRKAKKVLLPEMQDNSSKGYNGTDFIGNTYQIYRTILHQFAKDKNWNNVYSSPALPSGSLGTIKIEAVNVS